MRMPTLVSAACKVMFGLGHSIGASFRGWNCMSLILLIEQILNGLQFGIMLFLMAAGLTLIFGVMGLINLAHGSLYMIGPFAQQLLPEQPDRSCWD
jgi:ABC-type branched-subunit amino acid transport system permease subunit